jgi:hypothetical protein
MRIVKLVLALSLVGATASACAAAADDARRHLEAIAANNVESLMPDYSEGATMYWIGGPLDGTYTGPKGLRELWTKFAQAQGPLELAVAEIQENTNPKGATVTVNARFRGKSQTKIRYVLVYREGKIVAETWQIDPNMPFQN